ncbi:hypothetical protein [Halalkalibacterium halodurans]|uniref:Uncharacterized protein n=1 Tax=Halalkalibacterium halodurans TaxID=86665 RepID=A0A0M0KI44_ALKHA|nr:hypothetical protein [Halalkalibacterium halodurans]TPE68006.1 hypothetical protein AMD02_015710 [Halalkalibacterium halodurans]
MNNQHKAEYANLRKTDEFRSFLFWLNKIVDAEKEVKKASMGLTSNITTDELNSLSPDGKRQFVVDGEAVEHYQRAVSKYCKVHDKLFSVLEKLEQKYPAIFMTEEGKARKLGLTQQKEMYLTIIGELTPIEGGMIQ